MCEFYSSNDNGFGDIWWTDKLFYFSSIDGRYCALPFDGVKYVVGPKYIIHGSVVSYHSESFVISQCNIGNLCRIGTHQAVFRFS